MRTRVLTLVAVVLLLCIAPVLSADDSADRDRRARAAVAAAKAMSLTPAPAVASVAPAPRPAVPKDYAKGTTEAVEQAVPLVVYVSCAGPKVEGAVTCYEPAPTLGDVAGPAVVVGYPVGGRLVRETVLPCPADAKEVKKAVENAAKKLDPPPKAMPAPAPLDLQIRKAGCVCGDACACGAGKCPGSCPVATTGTTTAAAAPKPEPVIVGYAWTKVCNGNGTCRMVQTPIYR